MTLPALVNWDVTRTSLHRAANVLGTLRRAGVARQPNDTHLGLRVYKRGLSTGPLAFGEVSLDLHILNAVYEDGDYTTAIPLAGHDQFSLLNALLEAIRARGYNPEILMKDITSQESFTFDLAQTMDYTAVLNIMWRALGAFHQEINEDGHESPLVVWPHGFDMAFLWFPFGPGAADEHKDPHLGIGFSPGTPPALPRPYIYAYMWPLPEDMTAHPLPSLAHWHSDAFSGAVIHYDDLRGLENLEQQLRGELRKIFRVMRPLLPDSPPQHAPEG